MPAVVIMGPSGCGKTSLGLALASTLGWTFVEGDDLHPATNIEKMANGIPLSDEDRKPFLENVGKAIARHKKLGVVTACSALKKIYRDHIREYCPGAFFVLPPCNKIQLIKNIESRNGHFMPSSLIDSQLADLERPLGGEKSLEFTEVCTIEKAVQEILKAICK